MTGPDDSIHTGRLIEADLIPAAALRLAGVSGWRSLSLGDIALEADIPIAVLAEHFTNRAEILDGFERMIDRRMLAGAAAGDIGDKPRDRLFDIIMERFDALLPYRDGIRRVARDLPFDPQSGLVLATALPRSVAWMFAGARIANSGPLMPVKLAALGGIYLSVFRVWLKDEDHDLSKTMAALDRQIDWANGLFNLDAGRDQPAEPAVAEPPSDPAPAAPDVAPAAPVEPTPKPGKSKTAKKSPKPAPTDND